MMHTEKKVKQNLSKDKNSGYVDAVKGTKERFKYFNNQNKSKKDFLLNSKRFFNRHYTSTKMLLGKFDWKGASNKSLSWLLEALIEGLLANFVTHFLFGISFGVPELLAHGIFIKQGLSIISRIKGEKRNVRGKKVDESFAAMVV